MRAWITKLSLAPLIMLLPSLVVFAGQNSAVKEEYLKARQALDRSDFSTARLLFSKLADRGQVESQTALGLMYDKGLGVPQNYKKAVSWLRLAAEQNDPIAQYHLGVKYVNGHGARENPQEAYIWFAISFNNGNELAADPLRVLNQSLSTIDRQNALKVVVKKMNEFGK